MLDKNTILTLNKDPKSVDLHSLALAKAKNVQLNASANHQLVKDRMRTKKFKNYDEAYQKYIDLKKSGFLDLFNKKHGLTGKRIQENTAGSFLIKKIDQLLEMSPIAPFNGPGAGPDSTSKQFILREEYANKSSKIKKTFRNKRK